MMDIELFLTGRGRFRAVMEDDGFSTLGRRPRRDKQPFGNRLDFENFVAHFVSILYDNCHECRTDIYFVSSYYGKEWLYENLEP